MDNKPSKSSTNLRSSESDEENNGEENFQESIGEVTVEIGNVTATPVQESGMEESNCSPYIPEEL